MSDVSVNYKGEQIAALNDSGKIKLHTTGQYCEDIFQIQYIKPVRAIIPENDVVFWDPFDGSVFAAYSASEFASLSALPSNPSHEGYTSQGWNWTLSDAKTQVAKSGFLDIGQMYNPIDDDIRIYIHIGSILHNKPSLTFWQSVAGGVTVYWGDGTSEVYSSSKSFNRSHTYSAVGDYTIRLHATNGYIAPYPSTGYPLISTATQYANIVKKIELSSKFTADVKQICKSMYNLDIITLPSSFSAITANMFDSCRSLKTITIPNSCTSFPSQSFRYASGLKYICIPKNITSFGANSFESCNALKRVVIPEGVTAIPASAFYSCTSLERVYIPSTVTSIAAQAFAGCYAMSEYHIKATNPPTLANTNVFTNIQSAYCKIYVPAASVETYKSSNIWSTYASYIVGE